MVQVKPTYFLNNAECAMLAAINMQHFRRKKLRNSHFSIEKSLAMRVKPDRNLLSVCEIPVKGHNIASKID